MDYPANVEALERQLSEPSQALVEQFATMSGDILFLGVGGKMGPTMARMALNASRKAGNDIRVIGASRFSETGLRERLEAWGVECLTCDLLDPSQVQQLPDVAYVVYLVGFKFGASHRPARSWAINCSIPTMVAQRFPQTPIAALSTGNVYGMVDVNHNGSVESDALQPDGEYAMAALGRERVFQFYAEEQDVPVTLLRLNYATELRYGVLIDIAQQVHVGHPVDIATSHVNLIWMRDANEMILRSLPLCGDHAAINIAGPKARVADCAKVIGEVMKREVQTVGTERPTALLSDGSLGYQLLGTPTTSLQTMLEWSSQWIAHGQPLLGRPTKFQVRDGKF